MIKYRHNELTAQALTYCTEKEFETERVKENGKWVLYILVPHEEVEAVEHLNI